MRFIIFVLTFISFVYGNVLAAGCCKDLAIKSVQQVEKDHCPHHESSEQKSESSEEKKSHKACKVFCCVSYLHTIKLVSFQQYYLFSVRPLQSDTISPINGGDVLLRPPIFLS